MKFNTKSVRIFADKHLENIRSMFKTLYEDEILTDCTLISKGGSVKAHKVILASCSPYFRKIFSEHASDNAIFIMYGVTFAQLKDLIALIYKGCIDIPSDHLSSVFDLAEELEVSGILVEGKDTNYSQHGREENRQKLQGHKRPSIHSTVVNEGSASKIPKKVTENIDPLDKVIKSELQPAGANGDNATRPANHIDSDSMEPSSEASNDQYLGHAMDEQTTLSAWARQERKFQCDQCPSSFKRASHLSRHQLVHTGERPFPCDQCDKAFSRHDKLKNHVHKTHELELLNDALPPDSLYTIGHVQILTPEQTMIEMSGTIDTTQADYKPYYSPEEEEEEDDDDEYEDVSAAFAPEFKPYASSIRRKNRGRPRKYPIKTGPKRPRGRPRKFPTSDPIPKMKRPRGRPRIRPLVPKIKRPVGRPRIYPLDFSRDDKKNIRLLTEEELANCTSVINPVKVSNIMEPIVQIKTEPNTSVVHDPTEPEVQIFQNVTEPDVQIFQNVNEPDVQIFQNVAPPDLQIIPTATQPDLQIIPTAAEPDIQIIEDLGNVPGTQGSQIESTADPEKQEHISFFENIGLFENNRTVAKIGECTISVSGTSGSSSNMLAPIKTEKVD